MRNKSELLFHLFFIYFVILLNGLPQFGGFPLFDTTPGLWKVEYILYISLYYLLSEQLKTVLAKL